MASSSFAAKFVRAELASLAPHCHWTSGAWEGLDGLRWNEVQNTPQHVRLLSNHIVRLYVTTRRSVT